MVILILSLIFTAVFSILGLLAWLGLMLFRFRGHGRRVFKITLTALLVALPTFVFVISPILFSALLVNAPTRPQDRNLSDTPQTYGCSFEDVEFSSRDDLRLSGWYLGGEAAKPSFVIAHGLFRNRHEVVERACDFNKSGYPVILFDFRNHSSREGASASKAVSLGFQERLDVLGAVDFLVAEKGAQRVVLSGVSMGAVAVIHAAGQAAAQVEAIVADSPFISLDETVSRHTSLFLGLPGFPFADIFTWNLARKAGFEAADLDSAAALSRLPDTPLLLIYGQDDERMPEETGRALLDQAAAARKKISFFPGGHGHAYDQAPQRYVSEVLEFLNPPSHGDSDSQESSSK